MTTIEKPRCPDARRSYLGETDTCVIAGGMCLLESNTPCSIYEYFLAKADAEFDIAIHNEDTEEKR